MKKVWVLFLGIILILSFYSYALAAPTLTIKPYMVMMYENIQNDTVSEDMFRFIQLGFDTTVDFGQGGGFNSELQIHDVKTSSDSQLNGNSSGKTTYIDIRVGYAYLYQNNIFIKGDSFNVGVLSYPAFRNGYSNEPIWGSLGSLLSITGAVGTSYSIKHPTWDVKAVMANARVGTVGNDVSTTTEYDEGYNYGVRFNYKPVDGLTAGFGYQHKALQSALTSSAGAAADNYDTDWIVDASYKSNNLPLSGIIEYASVTPTTGGVEGDALTGAYAECAYKLGNFTAYAGRGVNLTSSSTNSGNYGNNIFNATSQPVFTNISSLYNINNNYTVIGLAYPVNPNLTVKGEYLSIDDEGTAIKGEKGFMIWFKASY